MVLKTLTRKIRVGFSVVLVIALVGFMIPVGQINTAKAAQLSIDTCHELYDALTADDGLSNHYALGENLDCTDAGLLAEDADTTLTGNDFLFGEFTGTLNGQGHQLTLDFASDNTEMIEVFGLFSELNGATVTGVDLNGQISFDLSSNMSIFNVGVIAGNATNSTITDITGQVQIVLGNVLNTDDQALHIQGIGGLVGNCSSACLLQNINIESSIDYAADFVPDDLRYIGGLVGRIERGLQDLDTIKNITLATELCVENAYYVGGLAGQIMSGATPATVSNVAVTSVDEGCGVTGAGYLGGLTGYTAANTIIRDSYTRLNVDSEGVGVEAYGGFVGKNDGKIYTSYSTGNVDAGDHADAGGFAGSNHNIIESSFSTAAAVDANGTHGGFVGWNNNDGDGIVGEVFNSAWVIIDATNAIGNDSVAEGPLAELADFDASNYDLATLDGVDLLKTTPTHDLYAGGDPVAHAVWDFDNVWDFDEGVNDDFPVLQMLSTPVVRTGELESVAKTSALVWGEIISPGSRPVVAYGFYYGTTEVDPATVADLADYDFNEFIDNTDNAGDWKDEPVLFGDQLTNLNCNTTYYYTFVAAQDMADDDTYAIGEELSFTTSACGGGGSSKGGSQSPNLQPKPNGTLIINNGTVYLLSGQQRIPFRDQVEYATHGYNFSQVVTASAADMGLPQGPIRKAMEGSLVLDSSDGITVYMIGLNETKRGFTSRTVFEALGYSFDNLPQIDLTDYQPGPVISDATLAHPEGSLVLSQGTVWWVLNGTRHGFESEAVFNTYGFSFAQAVLANDADMGLQVGALVKFRDGTLAVDGGNYYIISDGKKRQFTSEQSLVNWGYKLSNVIPASLQGYETGVAL